MSKRASFDSANLTDRAEQILSAASNRYRITVQVANRSKRLRRDSFDDFDSFDDPMMKPVIRAIVEISDELTEPGILKESSWNFKVNLTFHKTFYLIFRKDRIKESIKLHYST